MLKYILIKQALLALVGIQSYFLTHRALSPTQEQIVPILNNSPPTRTFKISAIMRDYRSFVLAINLFTVFIIDKWRMSTRLPEVPHILNRIFKLTCFENPILSWSKPGQFGKRSIRCCTPATYFLFDGLYLPNEGTFLYLPYNHMGKCWWPDKISGLYGKRCSTVQTLCWPQSI